MCESLGGLPKYLETWADNTCFQLVDGVLWLECVAFDMAAVNMHAADSIYLLGVFLQFIESSFCCHNGHYLGPNRRVSDIV